MTTIGETLIEQCAKLATFTEDAPRMTRVYLSDEHRRCGECLIDWMRSAGMTADFDALGNVVGRYEGSQPGAPVIMVGSHLDTVRDAGRYDGMLGIVTAIACVAEWHRSGRRLANPIEVIGFGDEEGVRFGVTMIGSAGMTGRFSEDWLDGKADQNGTTMREALDKFGAHSHVTPPAAQAWPTVKRDFTQVKAFLELHIEQGPVLLDAGLAVGVVTAIAGSSRVSVTVEGLAGHAGTVPMGARQDALAAAAEMVLVGESVASEWPTPLVCTTGKMSVAPGAINVIPGNASFTFDLRSGDDDERSAALAALQSRCEAIASRRKVVLHWNSLLELPAAPCDDRLRGALVKTFERHHVPVKELASGAGHDAMSFRGLAPIAMLFVRCGNGGISHHPDETITAADAELGAHLLGSFIEEVSSLPD